MPASPEDGALPRDARILITGGLGFIGSNLARRLVTSGADITLVDSLIPEYGGNVHNISGLEGHVRVNVADVRDPYAMRHLVDGIDIIFNLAGQTSHLDSMTDPHTDLAINVGAQLSILEACRAVNPGVRIVFASTRQIYGRPDYLPVDERHPIRPVDVNGIHKVAGEWHHLLYQQVYGMRTSALRLTNTYRRSPAGASTSADSATWPPTDCDRDNSACDHHRMAHQATPQNLNHAHPLSPSR